MTACTPNARPRSRARTACQVHTRTARLLHSSHWGLSTLECHGRWRAKVEDSETHYKICIVFVFRVYFTWLDKRVTSAGRTGRSGVPACCRNVGSAGSGIEGRRLYIERRWGTPFILAVLFDAQSVRHPRPLFRCNVRPHLRRKSGARKARIPIFDRTRIVCFLELERLSVLRGGMLGSCRALVYGQLVISAVCRRMGG